MDETTMAKESLGRKIAGEIVLSECPGKTMQKWRAVFKISQKDLSKSMGIMPSVVSDYESGRRKSPGIRVIHNLVASLLDMDERNGGSVIREFSSLGSERSIRNAILDIKEFEKPVTARDFAKLTVSVPVARADLMDRKIFGYTVIDSIKAIVNLSFSEMIKLYGLTTERALVFTQVERGRSPMVAIKVSSLRPGLVILHSPKSADEVAIRIAEAEGIPLAVSRAASVEKMMDAIQGLK